MLSASPTNTTQSPAAPLPQSPTMPGDPPDAAPHSAASMATSPAPLYCCAALPALPIPAAMTPASATIVPDQVPWTDAPPAPLASGAAARDPATGPGLRAGQTPALAEAPEKTAASAHAAPANPAPARPPPRSRHRLPAPIPAQASDKDQESALASCAGLSPCFAPEPFCDSAPVASADAPAPSCSWASTGSSGGSRSCSGMPIP